MLPITSQASGEVVNVWLTTDNQRTKMAPQAPLVFGPLGAGVNAVVVDETQSYQQIEGFGASFTDSSCYLLNQVATPQGRLAAMNNLFTLAGSGIGLNFVRNPMGASDFALSHYSYDDLPPGQTDPGLANFSVAHDQVNIIPLIQQAMQLNPQLKIMASPWSPPGWMKDSGSMIGGSLLPGMYVPFANYFVKYIQAYAAAGIPIDYISLQNEPLYVPADYPGMAMDAPTQTVLLRDYVLPALSDNGIGTQVMIYDHNWDEPDYPDTVLMDPTLLASSQVAGTAWHGYNGTPGVMFPFHQLYPDKGNYQTELSGGTWVGDQVKADFETITLAMRSWCKSFVKWNLALDQNRGPHTGGSSSCNPLVTVTNPSGAVSYTIEYYTLGHFSKFVRQGASRIYSSNGTGIVTVAFANPDGSRALVAFNESRTAQTVEVRWGNQSFSYSLAGLAGATFTWSGTQNGGYLVSARKKIQASSFNDTLGLQAEVTADSPGGYDVGYADDSDYAIYRNIDFGTGITAVDVRMASPTGGGRVEFHLDGVTGPLIATAVFPKTGGWQTWKTVTKPVSGASGIRSVYVVFKGGIDIGNLGWFTFK